MRGRAMVKPALKGLAVSAATIPPLMLPEPGWAIWALNFIGAGAFYMSAVTLAVLFLWNVLHPDTEERDARLEAAREHQRMIMEHASPRAARTQWERAVLEARRAGTFSLNGVRQPGTTLRYPGRDVTWTYDEIVTAAGREWEARHYGPQPPGSVLRYPGPPPVYTPPGGFEVVIHVELRAEPKMIHGRGGPLSPDHGWTCEECGEPVTEGRRFCRPCLTHGMPGYNAPEPHSGTCDRCGKQTGMCMRAGEGHLHYCYGCAYG